MNINMNTKECPVCYEPMPFDTCVVCGYGKPLAKPPVEPQHPTQSPTYDVEEVAKIIDLHSGQLSLELGRSFSFSECQHIKSHIKQAVKQSLLAYGEKLRGENETVTKAYQTVKDWAHRVQNQMTSILERCDDSADGAPDASPLGKFANELIGLSNDIMLSDVRGVIQMNKDLQSTNAILETQLLTLKQSLGFPYTDMTVEQMVVGVENLKIANEELGKRVDVYKLAFQKER